MHKSTLLFSLKKEGNSDTTWMNLEDIIICEVSQSQKDKDCLIPLMQGNQSGQKSWR